MARRSSRSGRNTRGITRRTPAPDAFDDNWFDDISERFDARYIDLTRSEDRRRWHPLNLQPYTYQPGPRGLFRRPRVVIVPEGHRLARRQTYGGKYSLREVLSRNYRYTWSNYQDLRDRVTGRAYKGIDDLSRRVGFALPWQVVICVRRKRRREVMHALGIAGGSGIGRHPQRRNEYSEVRC